MQFELKQTDASAYALAVLPCPQILSILFRLINISSFLELLKRPDADSDVIIYIKYFNKFKPDCF